MEISRARDGAGLVTSDAAEPRPTVRVVADERIAALDDIGEM